MHILKGYAVGDVVHALPVPVVVETLREGQLIDFFLGGQTLAADVRLCKDDSEEVVAVAREPDDTHRGFRKEAIVKGIEVI